MLRSSSHFQLAVLSGAVLGAAAAIGPWAGAGDRLSIVSAYLCLILMGGALTYGPVHAVRYGRPLANSPLRRSMGIWSALNGLLHFLLANVLAMNYEYLGLYVENAVEPPSSELRSDLYSWGTISGYLIAIAFILLLALSNDRAVRRLGMTRWKRIQRITYIVFLLTCGHAFAFQILETRSVEWIYMVLLVLLFIIAGQGLGIFSVNRSRRVRSAPTGT